MMIDLSEQYDIKKLIKGENPEVLMKKRGDLYVMKYDKRKLVKEDYNRLGLFRSVITDGNSILSYSPSKSMNYEDFKERYKFEDCMREEFVEGTMIHCFYYNGNWEVSTRFCIGANSKFYRDNKKTFRELTVEAMAMNHFSFQHLNQDYSYIFVMQHPENRIVIPFDKSEMVLIGIYKMDGYKVLKMNKMSEEFDDIRNFVKVPNKYEGDTCWEEMERKYASSSTDWNTLGVMIWAPDGTRAKIRNPNYENVRKLKGNNPKMQFQYYSLRKMDKVREFLEYYPEYKKEFDDLRDDLHRWTVQLWKNYLYCFVNHSQALQNFPRQYRPHMINLHEKYMNELRLEKGNVSRDVVIEYVKCLAPAQLMYVINYDKRSYSKKC